MIVKSIQNVYKIKMQINNKIMQDFDVKKLIR